MAFSFDLSSYNIGQKLYSGQWCGIFIKIAHCLLERCPSFALSEIVRPPGMALHILPLFM